MPILNITDMKVVSPSPDNFILDLEISGNHYNYIASGEHIYQNNNGTINNELINNHVAHSSIFEISCKGHDISTITAYSLFDMNDMGITTEDEDLDNLLLMPNANTIPSARVDNPISMHGINSNAIYGYISTDKNSSFGFPEYNNSSERFVMSTHNKIATGNPEPGTTDTLTLYYYRKFATNVSSVLGLGKQTDINSSENGFDKLFIFDPTNDNSNRVDSDVKTWRSYQSNRRGNGVTNNFDNSTLLARAILFPKQTLNNEYSTERIYVPSTEVSAPFKQVRRYNFKNEDYFYSNGTHIVLNHRDDTKFIFDSDTDTRGGTMITSTYNRRFGSDEYGREHLSPKPPDGTNEIIELENGEKEIVKVDYSKYGTFKFGRSEISAKTGMFNQYSPELINRENETMSDTALMTSIHKANIFDIKFNSSIWNSIGGKIDEVILDKEAASEIKENLKQSIKSNLFKLVDEIKPAHTELYKITITNED